MRIFVWLLLFICLFGFAPTPERTNYLMPDTPVTRMYIEFNVQAERRAGIEPRWGIVKELVAIKWLVVKAPILVGQAANYDMTPDYTAHTFGDPLRDQQYSLQKLNAEQAWRSSRGGVIVAVVDTGVDATHPDLAGKIVAGYDFVNRDDSPDDDQGHGTHVAGIACATPDNDTGIAGVGFDCKIMPVKVLDSNGGGNHSIIAEGIIWATDHSASVINLSLGGTTGSGALRDAVKYATSRGVIVVAAAGNDGTTEDNFPAAYPEAISVCATDQNDVVARFSNQAKSVDVCAPGVAILSTVRGGKYEKWNGTSMATPNVSGVAALLVARGWRGLYARQRIERTLDPAKPRGRVNAARAVE